MQKELEQNGFHSENSSCDDLSQFLQDLQDKHFDKLFEYNQSYAEEEPQDHDIKTIDEIKQKYSDVNEQCINFCINIVIDLDLIDKMLELSFQTFKLPEQSKLIQEEWHTVV